MSNCTDCLYVKVCSDFSAQGCCDADCCSDFEPKADFLQLKRHIGDHLYEVIENQIITYTISQIVLQDDRSICYILDPDIVLADTRATILESELGEVYLTYGAAQNQLYKESAHCSDCLHFNVCGPAKVSAACTQNCKDYVKSTNAIIYPCSVGQEFYVVQPAAHKFNISVPCPITRYVVDHIYVSHHSSCSSKVIVLHDGQNHWINVSSFDNFKHLLGRAFFDTQKAAEEELRDYIFLEV